MRLRALLLPLVALAAIPFAGAAGAGGLVPIDPEAVRAALESSWAERAGEGETMEIVRVPELSAPAAGDVLVTWPDPPLPPGPRALTVGVRVDGRVVARGFANVMLRRKAPVWILARSVARGDTLTAADLRREDRVWDRPPVRALTDDPPARGFVALRALNAGQWIRRDDVRARPDVEAGSDVLLVTRSGEATVSLAARTRRGGFIGDVILVLNPLNGTVVRARLLDARHAELVSSHRSPERSRP
jgi:flagella basal body P-ring formation protein FlgA